MNAGDFKPGDAAITCNKTCPCCNGLEVVVLEGPTTKNVLDHLGGTARMEFGYVVSAATAPAGFGFFCRPHELRRPDPPREDLQKTTWDTCPWWPEKIVTEIPA